MDKKVIALFLIALLGGLIGGYGLGYVIYQPQIQNLQNDMDNLRDEFQLGDDNINDELEDLQISILALNSNLNAINSSLEEMQASITTLNTEQSTLNTELETLSSSLTNLQSLLSTLNTRLADLNATIRQIENRSWHQVYSVSASSNVTSGTFQLKGKEFRVMWGAWGQSSSSWLSIGLRFSNGTLYSYYGSSGIFTATNVEEDLVQSGQYYLTIISYQTDYDLILWDYY